MHRNYAAATGVLVASLAFALSAVAQDGMPPLTLEFQTARPQAARDPEGFWTQSQMQNAVSANVLIPAYAQSVATTNQLLQALNTMGVADTVPAAAGVGQEGAAPAEPPQPNLADMLYQAPAASVQRMQSELIPTDVGQAGAHFTSSRYVPQSSRLAYPYTTVGKLFFRTPRGASWCSAAILRPRIILTAGHCVHSGAGGANGWYSNWLFVPAYESGQAPFQAWNWRWVITTGTWAGGGGTVPNAGDWAILELEDRTIGGQATRIGQWLGYLGYHTNVLQNNHIKTPGYPGNFDGGEIPHQVDAQSFRNGGTNTWLYGSDARGGSSGSAMIMNFGVHAAGQTGGLMPWPNRIVGVISYGYIATGPKVQGSSILNNEFLNILKLACDHRAGNC